MGLVLLLAGSPPAAAAPGLKQALVSGQPSLDLRLRFEAIEQDNAARDADALTLRPRLGYQTGRWQGLDAFVEYEGIYAVGGDADYNSGPPVLSSTNGRTGFSTIAEPTGEEVNRAWLRYSGLPDTVLKAGRQRIILDDARFIGNVGWRSDEQTFDAISVVNRSIEGLTATYAYLDGQNFIFFNRNGLSAHLLNLGWQAHPALKLTGYAYLIDFDQDSGPRVPGTPDHRNLGLRAAGDYGRLSYALEYADQSDYADSRSSLVEADYHMLELGLQLGPVKPQVGYQRLSGDGDYGFATPFGTNHAFQGWADVFLNTPPGGIEDRYFSVSGTLEKVKLMAVYHDFRSDEGSLDYGAELDLLAARPITERLKGLVKYARYEADDFSVDTDIVWAMLEFSFK